jgi:quinol monooxygenase YgiN
VLIVSGSFELDPAQRDAFIASRLEAMASSRLEDGCYDYVMSADPIDPARVCLYERWESQEHLDAHLAALYAARGDGDGGPTPLSRSVAVYDIAGERALGG